MTLAMETAAVKAAAPPNPLLIRMLVSLFAATMFVSASLLFWIQPLFAKMVLPFFGGVPAVWNTAMMFFQATLLLGYGYVHFVNLKLPPRWQAITHLIIIITAFVSLPVAVRGAYYPDSDPVQGLLALLALSIGLPFFVVSATAPLLQRWFALSGHRHADDPYFLYGASNLGSILALIAFPFILEPFFSLPEQGVAWSSGFVVLLVLIGLCSLVPAGKAATIAKTIQARTKSADGKQIWRQRLFWIALAFAPSSLLLGVTQHISTDIAAFPLLWVIPLTLYLLTYVIVFARRPILPHKWVIQLQPYLLAMALPCILFQGGSIWFNVSMHLSVFFVLALSCHGELVKRRPEVGRLTEFYLCMSIGGLLGGAFNVLAAPVLFTGVYEYGLAIAAAASLRPGPWRGPLRNHLLDIGLPATVAVAAIAIHKFGLQSDSVNVRFYGQLILFGFVGIAVFGFKDRPLRFGLGVGAALLLYGSTLHGGDILAQSRSFFGVYRVKVSTDGSARQLYHGTTLHGSQLLDASMALEPVSYYSRQGPLGQLFKAFRGKRSDLNVGLVGLGIGSTLCYSRPGDRWTVFEIDPLVATLARDERYFTLVRDCAKKDSTKFLFGDARLRLQRVPNASFDVLILDAYSSDAVPIHLLSREALALYRKKLAQAGTLMFHVSNRHLELDRVMSALVSDLRLTAFIQRHKPDASAPKHAAASHWIVVTEKATDLTELLNLGKWQKLPEADLRPWTDDYSNIIDVLK